MRRLCLLGLLICTTVFQTLAQKRIADQREYELFTQVVQEREPAIKITLLLAWEANYPDSDYKRERSLMLAAGACQAVRLRMPSRLG
jgi:hypothetical protein